MKSVVAVTSEIDDPEAAAEELTTQIRDKIQLERNSVAIAYCDADVDVAAVGDALHTKLGMDVVGLTTTATVERYGGYHDMGIVLCVLTADDVSFSIGCTGELENDSYRESIRETYRQSHAKLPEDPALIMALAPYIAEITSENYVEILDEASGGLPIFGGVATDHYDLQYQKTFLNGSAYTRSLIFILMAGKLKPVFAMEHHFGAKAEKKGVITKSSGNLIQMVGDQTFMDFVASIVPIPEEELVIYHFQSTPFVMELPDYEKNEQPVVRALSTLDHESGVGGFLTKMPEGSAIYMNMIQRENLNESCNGALADMIKKMKGNGDYVYSMIFISTCNARHLLMGDTKSLESDIISESLDGFPPGLNAMGYYGFGEICPTGTKLDGRAKNRFHNVSFALCAI